MGLLGGNPYYGDGCRPFLRLQAPWELRDAFSLEMFISSCSLRQLCRALGGDLHMDNSKCLPAQTLLSTKPTQAIICWPSPGSTGILNFKVSGSKTMVP